MPQALTLYLVQHAEALSEEKDPQRPLSDKGHDEITRMADFLADSLAGKVSMIHYSGKLSAEQTARKLSEYLKPPGGLESSEGLTPNDDPGIWARRIAELSEDVMLVGHLPHLSRLASMLVTGEDSRKVVDFCMAGTVCLKRDEEGKWSVAWMVVPDMV